MRRLTTHVLDTMLGQPAGGLKLELFRLTPKRERCTQAVTNADGRTAAPLLEGADLPDGTYEIIFHAGDYLRAKGQAAGAGFLDLIPVRFEVNEDRHYHVPLLLSAYGYSTYRGS